MSHTTKDCSVTWSGLIRKLMAGWLISTAVAYWCLPDQLKSLTTLDGLAQTSFPLVLVCTCLVGGFLLLLSRLTDTLLWERLLMGIGFGALALGCLIYSFTWPFLIACLLLGSSVAVYVLRGENLSPPAPAPRQKPQKLALWALVALTGLFVLYISLWFVARVKLMRASTYDFGIFAQMFHYMRTTGLPLTTLERDGLLSHFAVHVSPIYYLMLPVYWLFPQPLTLQILQVLIIASGVIPLWLLCKHHGLAEWQRMLLCTAFLLYPALSGGCSYDLHENCFLTPLILWLLYGLDRKKPWIIGISTVLTLCVKEDAAVYVAVIGLWVILRYLLSKQKKDNALQLWAGLGLLAVSLIWFLAATGYLANHGDGVMTYRYKNFMYDNSRSLITVIKALVMNPLKGLYECVDPEKLQYIGLTLVPLLGLPLITRRYERYLLLIPYLLINLMTDYQYQYNIFFQYNFGSLALLFYLTLVNLSDLKLRKWRLPVIAAVAVLTTVFFCANLIPKIDPYLQNIHHFEAKYTRMRESLEVIPEDASVVASTFLTPVLSQRDVLYDIGYASRDHVLECEYVALRLGYSGDYQLYNSPGQKDGYEQLLLFLEENGYQLYHSIEGQLEIYRKQ